jgi:hypothetical protein
MDMKFFLYLFFLLISSVISAQTGEMKGLAGYVDFGDLASVYGEPKVRINIGKQLLQFVSWAAKDVEDESAQLFNKLDAVRIEVYNLNDNAGPAIDTINNVAKKLPPDNWEPIVTVNDGEDHVRIYAKAGDNVMNGLVVMVVDGQEAVFINIIGDIDPAQLGKVTNALDIDVNIPAEGGVQ